MDAHTRDGILGRYLRIAACDGNTTLQRVFAPIWRYEGCDEKGRCTLRNIETGRVDSPKPTWAELQTHIRDGYIVVE